MRDLRDPRGLHLEIYLLLNHIPEYIQEPMMLPRRVGTHQLDDVMNRFNGGKAVDMRLLANDKFRGLRRMEHNLRQGLKTAARSIHGPGHAPGGVQNNKNVLLTRG